VHDLIPLSQLRAGQSARVGQLMGAPDEVHRLEELGLREGESVEMVQSGSPCIVQLSGSRLCFRHTDLFNILVQPGVASE